jgi:hypothetical protein
MARHRVVIDFPLEESVSKRYKVPQVVKSWDWRGSNEVQDRVVVEFILVGKGVLQEMNGR